jgi:hypothetical protein
MDKWDCDVRHVDNLSVIRRCDLYHVDNSKISGPCGLNHTRHAVLGLDFWGIVCYYSLINK